ncbi:MAG: Gfo/Idh/MocA family oxidoreductase [Candidatus Brocadiia bacterium]|nr:Gfo/Idh/MocA family oxidoreductase [Candidatus Brocadiia bacterium]
MVKVGIIGLGGMGNMHLGVYQSLPKSEAEVVAIADIDPAKLKPGESSQEINIGAGAGALDRDRMNLCESADELIADPNVDLVDITLPTFLHADCAVKALRAGKHVLCEKPMAMNGAECDRMLAAQRESGKALMIAQCLRFWPEYAYLKELVDSGRLGRLTGGHFWRGSTAPDWAWDNWLLDAKRSGGAILDLHVHDVDTVNYLLGVPKAVFSTGSIGVSGGYDIVDTVYVYGDANMSIHAGANWTLPKGFQFEMRYAASFENGCLTYSSTHSPTLIETSGEEAIRSEVADSTGYAEEIPYFLRCLETGAEPTMCPPASSADSVRIAVAEMESARTGKLVEV